MTHVLKKNVFSFSLLQWNLVHRIILSTKCSFALLHEGTLYYFILYKLYIYIFILVDVTGESLSSLSELVI